MMAASSTNEFGLNLLSVLAKNNGQDNLFLSPFSISVALAMTRLGATAQTASEMEKALCWKSEANVIHQEFKQYIELLKKPNDTFALRTANRIYIEKGYSILEIFLKQTKELYLAEPVLANFKSDAEAERIHINTWVEEQTENKIKDLIGKNVLNGLTRMVLVNAIYFKAQWRQKFDGNDTRPAPFYVSPSKEKSVPTMNMSKFLPFYKAKDYSVLELPYKGDQISMLIFLPEQRFGLETLEKTLKAAEIKEAISQLATSPKVEVEVSLPKFEMNCSMGLSEILPQLGMTAAFDPNVADFSGIDGTKDLFISEVVHKAFLKVDEEGTEAAAATAVMMFNCAFVENITVPFIADHPFLVVIQDKTNNNMILFMGHIVDPYVPS